MRVLAVNAGSSSLKLRLLGSADELEATSDLGLEHGEIDERQAWTIRTRSPTASFTEVAATSPP